MKIIEAIREARKIKWAKYIAIDEDATCFAYGCKVAPEKDIARKEFDFYDKAADYHEIGKVKLSCHWEKTLIKLSDIKVK